MSTLTIKVTLNPINPEEAELIKILGDKQNKSGHLKLAALHYWNITGRARPGPDNTQTINKAGSHRDELRTPDKQHNEPVSVLEKSNAFADSFSEI